MDVRVNLLETHFDKNKEDELKDTPVRKNRKVRRMVKWNGWTTSAKRTKNGRKLRNVVLAKCDFSEIFGTRRTARSSRRPSSA